MGGGGGDGGFAERQDRQDADKARAREALNVLFGVAPTSGPPDRSKFTTTTPQIMDGDSTVMSGGEQVFDQAGYDAAVAAHAAQAEAATRNKADLEALFGNVRTNAFDAGKRRIEEQKGEAGRNLKFELFARGQNGGSEDVDQNALLGRISTQGLTDLGGKADATSTQLRGDNESTRLQLLQSIDSGMDQGSAVSSALGQLRVNSDKAAADAIGTSVGDLFANSGLIYNQNRVAQGRQNAQNWWANNTPTTQPRGGAGARTGIVSPS